MPFLTPGKTSNAIDRNAVSADRTRRNWQRLTQGAATRTLSVDGQSLFINSGGALEVLVSPTGAIAITPDGLAVQVDGVTVTIVNDQLVAEFSNFVVGEVPSGTVDGTNPTFTLAHTPIAGTVAVYVDGVRMLDGSDYTISGAVITFQTGAIPETGDLVQADYQY